MKISTCTNHPQEEERYICVHPLCIRQVDNKLSCIQCYYSNHKKIRLEQHQIINISELEQKANNNYKSLITHFHHEIEKNSQLNSAIEERLATILQSLSVWQNNQKKIFNDIAENSSYVLNNNIFMADNLMKNPTIDTIIYFFKLNLLETQTQNKDIRENSMRQLEYQLKQIEDKRDVLINQKNFTQRDHFLKFAQIDYQIQFNKLGDFEYEKCQQHLIQKEMLCTHPNCLNNNPQKLQCMNCIAEEHQEHLQGRYVKSISTLQNEQQEKIELIEQLKKKFNSDIKESIDKNLQKINESQQNNYYTYEKQKEKATFLEQQQQTDFLDSDSPNLIFENIDLTLLQKTKDQIHLSYKQLYHNFELKFGAIYSEKVNDNLKLCTELDFDSKQFFKYIINLENEIQLLQIKLQVLQKQNEAYTQNHQQNEFEIKTQSNAIINLKSDFEKSIETLKEFTETMSSSQTDSFQSLLQGLEKSIQKSTETISQSQTISIKNSISILRSSISSLRQLIEDQQKTFETQQQNNQIVISKSIKSTRRLISMQPIFMVITFFLFVILIDLNGRNFVDFSEFKSYIEHGLYPNINLIISVISYILIWMFCSFIAY